MRPTVLLAPLGAALVVACGGGDPAARATDGPRAAPAARPAQPPALCTARTGRTTGTVADPAAAELSGLAASPRRAGLLWSHNDSGDAPRLWALRPDGTVLGRPAVTGAANRDWEDLAVARGRDGRSRIYVADTGDNTRSRTEVAVLRVDEPAPGAAATAPAAAIRLRYPDGPHDAEALLVDGRAGRLVIVTKALGETRAYSAPARPGPGLTTLRRGPRVPVSLVLGGSLSADGRILALRSVLGVHLWRRRGAEPLTRTLARRPCLMPARAGALQGEAVALSRRGDVAWTVDEGAPARIRRFPAR